MVRPRKCRRVCGLPGVDSFGPLDDQNREAATINMTVEEYESIRLVDLEGKTQQECSEIMGVARTTVQSIYDAARKKLADALVNGKRLYIAGGSYELCDGHQGHCKGCMECGKRKKALFASTNCKLRTEELSL